MQLILTSITKNNMINMELINLDNIARIYQWDINKIRFQSSDYDLWWTIPYVSYSECDAEFDRLMDEIFVARSEGKNIITFETDYYGGKK